MDTKKAELCNCENLELGATCHVCVAKLRAEVEVLRQQKELLKEEVSSHCKKLADALIEVQTLREVVKAAEKKLPRCGKYIMDLVGPCELKLNHDGDCGLYMR